MKKQYRKPYTEFVRFHVRDVVVASGVDGNEYGITNLEEGDELTEETYPQ